MLCLPGLLSHARTLKGILPPLFLQPGPTHAALCGDLAHTVTSGGQRVH